MEKEIFVLGDIEIGGGTLTDDFIADKVISNLFLEFSKKEHGVDLILNGDTFDFLKCPLIKGDKIEYVRHISCDVSFAKLESMRKAHPRFFSALRKFVCDENHRLFFIIGNHDQDLFFRGVQRKIRHLLGSKRNIFFALFYKEGDVYVEHGQQYDFVNKANLKRLFLNYRGEKILNIPWVELALMSKFMTLKEEHPFLERIKPYPLVFTNYKIVLKKLNYRSLGVFLKSLFYYPLRHFNDPTYTFPRKLISEFYRRLRKTHWDVDDIFRTFKRRRRKVLVGSKIAVLGHVHQRYMEEAAGKIFIHPDTWRDEYLMDEKTKMVTSKSKNYVRMEIRDGKLFTWELAPARINQRTYLFDEIVKDELGMLAMAAGDEGYKIRKPKRVIESS